MWLKLTTVVTSTIKFLERAVHFLFYITIRRVMKEKFIQNGKHTYQVNVGHGNAKISATQIINEVVVEEIPKMMSPDPIPYTHYVSRGREKAIIDRIKKERILLLKGVGGIGKTTTAKRIYELAKYEYDHVAWITYDDNWQTSVVNNLFVSYFHFGEHSSEKERYKKIVECVTNLQDEQTLFVIDNFNRINSAELDEIRKLPVDLLITTRYNLTGISEEYVDMMNPEEGESLFYENYKRKEELTYRDKKDINEIVKLSQGYPLVIELIARAISYKNVKIIDFLQELKSKDYRIENIDLSADSDWNGRDVNEQLAEQLSKVYQLSELNGQEAEFIKIMSLLPPLSIISYKDIAKYVATECKEALITLDYRGWIKQTQEGIIMHEIVCESIYKYNEFSYEECIRMLDSLEKDSKIGTEKDVKATLKYAEYAYSVISIMKNNSKFCKHLFLKEAALVFKENGKYEQAKELLDIIITAYDADSEKDKLLLSEFHNNYSKILSMESDMEKALQEAICAEKMIDSMNKEKDAQYALNHMIVKKTVAMDYAHKKDYKTAFKKMKEALCDIDEISEEEKCQIANLYSDYARLYLDVGDISGSIEKYEETIKKYNESKVSLESPWRFTTYTNYANALVLNKDWINANNYAFQALIGKYTIYEEPNYAIANALLVLGNIYKSEKQLWDVADVFYKKALKIVRQESHPDKFCDILAGLAIVEQNMQYALQAYRILKMEEKKCDISTYINVMEVLILESPQEVLDLGERALMQYMEEENVSSRQYLYALMGKAGYLLNKKEIMETYLDKAYEMEDKRALYFYEETKKIENSIPMVKGEYEKKGMQDMSERENNHTIINGVQINIGKDNAVIYAQQNNGTVENELNDIVNEIMEQIGNLEEEKAKEIIDIVEMSKEELEKEKPRESRLKNCLTLLQSAMTIANGIPKLIGNLKKLQELIMQYL